MIGDLHSRGNFLSVPGTELAASAYHPRNFASSGLCYESEEKPGVNHQGCFKIENPIKKGSAMERKSKFTIAIAAGVLAVLGATAIYAQDKYALKSPSGIAFSDFRGYEDWSVVSSARTDEVLKVIVANPAMINAYKAGVPGNGQSFPEGSMIAKLQWKPKKSTEAPFAVDVPDVFAQDFVM